MEHPEAMRLIDAAADGRLSPAERQALEDHLATCAECRAYAGELSALEAGLQRALQRRYPQTQGDVGAIEAVLGKILTRTRRQTMIRTLFRTAAWTSLAVLFVLAITWSISNLLAHPPVAGEQTSTPQEIASTPTAQTAPRLTQQPALTPLPPESRSNPLFPGVQFELGAELPPAPEQVTVYVQQLPEPASLEAIRQMAARLGLEAPVYQRPGEGPEPVYVVSDGFHSMTFPYGSAEVFLYVANEGSALSTHGPERPFEELSQAASAFLTEAGLLENTPVPEHLPNSTNGVGFTRTLEGRPVINGIGYAPGHGVEVEFDPDGKVSQVNYGPFRALPAGEYPILSAEQAWEAFLSGKAMNRLRYGVSGAYIPSSLQTWQRSYPTGEPIHMYGYVSVLQPAEPGGTPLASFNNWLVAGANASTFASQTSPYEFWHAWGQMQPDEQGRLAFHVEGWEISPYEERYLQGSIHHQGEKAWLETDEGDFDLPELPADVPEGVFTEARGVVATQGVLDWWLIQTGTPAATGYSMMEACMGGGGGGGGDDFGGGAFRRVSLLSEQAESTSTPATMPSPFQPGQAVDGASGTASVQQHISIEGSSQIEFYFSGEPVGSFTDPWAAHLSGEGAQGLMDLNDLPVRIWGRVSGIGSDGWPNIEVERFEEVYPGLRFQAWLGTWQAVTLEGKDVVVLTTVEGEKFVLSSSIDYGSSGAAGLEGDRIVIEGLAIPGQTFGGYPVITEFSSTVMSGDQTDLSAYEITSNKPRVYDESTGETAQALKLSGRARAEKVELVYATASMAGCRGGNPTESNPELAPYLYVQPVWRFTGSFEDGRTFEIQIQALDEAYLK
jgi:Putative zinc-finger